MPTVVLSASTPSHSAASGRSASRRSSSPWPRPITGSYPYVYLDGVSLKRNWGGEVRNVLVRIADFAD